MQIGLVLKVDVALESSPGGLLLPESSERFLEGAMVEATRLITKGIRLSTRQWFLDTRYPVESFRYKGITADRLPVGQRSPPNEGWRKVPHEMMYVLNFSSNLGLNPDIWAETEKWVANPPAEIAYDELIHDGDVFLSQRATDVAFLFAAIAIELLVDKLCHQFLTSKGLTPEQSAALVSRGQEARLRLLKTLTTNVSHATLKSINERRNLMAHSGNRKISIKEASDALKLAHDLRRLIPQQRWARQHRAYFGTARTFNRFMVVPIDSFELTNTRISSDLLEPPGVA